MTKVENPWVTAFRMQLVGWGSQREDGSQSAPFGEGGTSHQLKSRAAWKQWVGGHSLPLVGALWL